MSAKEITLTQGSAAWLAWRREGIGASESAALLGFDPYGNTPRTLYMDKTGPESHTEESEHLRAGHEIEAMVRASHEFDTGYDWPPVCFQHHEFEFLRASLDGWCEPLQRGIEVKLVSGTILSDGGSGGGLVFVGQNHERATDANVDGQSVIQNDLHGAGNDDSCYIRNLAASYHIPPHHLIQCQHQLLVTASDSITYIRHARAIGKTEKIEIREDKNIQRDILAACWDFWDRVQTKRPPDYIDADWVPSQDSTLTSAVEGWKSATTTAARKSARSLVLALCINPRTLCAGIKIQKAPFQERVWNASQPN